MTKAELDFIGSMNMCDQISDEAYKEIVCHCGDPCEDAISREEFERRIKPYDTQDPMDKALYNFAHNILISCPSVQPEEYTGHWVRISPAKIYECSECGQTVMTDDIECYRYCHGCGAEMKGGD